MLPLEECRSVCETATGMLRLPSICICHLQLERVDRVHLALQPTLHSLDRSGLCKSQPVSPITSRLSYYYYPLHRLVISTLQALAFFVHPYTQNSRAVQITIHTTRLQQIPPYTSLHSTGRLVVTIAYTYSTARLVLVESLRFPPSLPSRV